MMCPEQRRIGKGREWGKQRGGGRLLQEENSRTCHYLFVSSIFFFFNFN